MAKAKPVHLGDFDPVVAGDIIDFYIDVSGDLATGEALSSVAFVVTDSDGDTVANVIGVTPTVTDSRVDFRVTAPAAGRYTITADFTIDDGQSITHTATLTVE